MTAVLVIVMSATIVAVAAVADVEDGTAIVDNVLTTAKGLAEK